MGARFTNLYLLTYIRNDKELYHRIGNTVLNSKFIFLNVLADTFIRNFAKAILLMTEAYSKPCQYIFLQNAPSKIFHTVQSLPTKRFPRGYIPQSK